MVLLKDAQGGVHEMDQNQVRKTSLGNTKEEKNTAIFTRFASSTVRWLPDLDHFQRLIKNILLRILRSVFFLSRDRLKENTKKL